MKRSPQIQEPRRHHGVILAVTCPELLGPNPDAIPENSITTKYVAPKEGQEREFAFDYIYGPWLTIKTIYDDVIQPLIPKLVKGVNCSVLLGGNGMAGDGGAFSLDGTPHRPGLILMAMKDLFYELETTNTDYDPRLAISYFEVSQGKVLDLINYTGKELQVRESDAGVDIPGLYNVLPRDVPHLMDIISEGTRQISQCPMTSSKSHAIFQVQIQLHSRRTFQDTWNPSPAIAAKLVLVNLFKFHNGNNDKGESTESRSLLALSDCLSGIASGRADIPFGESTLTTILKDSLGGSSNTVLVARAGAAVTSKQRFPDWIWSEIISNLDEESDFINVSRTCRGLDQIVKGIIPQFRMEIEKSSANCQHPSAKEEASYISAINKAILGPNHDFRTKFVVGGKTDFSPDMKLYKIELAKRVEQGQISYSAEVSITKHCCTHDNINNCVWNLLPQLIYRIFKSVPYLRSIRVDGVDECEKANMIEFDIWDEDLENPMPPLSHQGAISAEFTDQSPGRIYSRLNKLKSLIFRSYHTQILSYEMELWWGILNRCSYLTNLKLTGIDFNSPSTICRLKRLDAPQLLELSLMGNTPLGWFHKSDPEPALYHDHNGLSILELGKALATCPRLRVLKLSIDTDFNSPAIELGICSWKLAGNTCKPNRGPMHVNSELMGEHDQDHHQKVIWWFLPQNLDELQMEWLWSSGFDDGSRYVRYHHPTNNISKVFKRDGARSMIGNLESFQGR